MRDAATSVSTSRITTRSGAVPPVGPFGGQGPVQFGGIRVEGPGGVAMMTCAESGGGEGVDVCLTVTHLDSLVMARSGFHHSVNYRAVMAFGKAHVIDDPEEKLKLMDRFIDRIYPGRSKLIRQPNKQEFKATTMIGMEIEMASCAY